MARQAQRGHEGSSLGRWLGVQAGLLCSSMQGMAACPIPGVGMGAVAWLWRGPAVS